MNKYEKYKNIEYNHKKKNLFFIALVFLFVAFFVIATRKSIPSQISIFDNEERTINLLTPVMSLSKADDFVAVSMSNDNKVTIGNVNKGNTTKTDGKVTFKLLGIPIKSTNVNVMNTKELIPSGKSVGINIKTDGIMVLGTNVVTDIEGNTVKPWENKLKAKDIIMSANGKPVQSKEELMKIIDESDSIEFAIDRDGVLQNEVIIPIKSKNDGRNKIGIWVRDGTEGIGTLTYINPNTNNFGALGHGILDVDTNQLMPIYSGEVLESRVTTINKGEKGSPGELVGEISKQADGEVLLNTKHGIYGVWTSNIRLEDAIPVALKEEIQIGSAKILCEIGDFGVKEYDIDIEAINVKSVDEKGMVIRITDDELISQTNGIIQGMSGSPIIQNGKIVGAVTHVFVQEPTKGYGIFIENMLNEEKNIKKL